MRNSSVYSMRDPWAKGSRNSPLLKNRAFLGTPPFALLRRWAESPTKSTAPRAFVVVQVAPAGRPAPAGQAELAGAQYVFWRSSSLLRERTAASRGRT